MKLFIAAGGTGGHIFPGISVAEAFLEQDKNNQVVFIGTTTGLEGTIVPAYGFRLVYIEARQFLGKGVAYKIFTLLHVLQGIRQGISLIKQEKPDAILGMGGFTSVPIIIAGLLLGIPRFLHEQNVKPGLANRLLSRFSTSTFISFEVTKEYLKKRNNVYHTGNPLRKKITTERKEKSQDTFGIFVFGGSRGATRINESVLTLLPFLESYKNTIMYHQTGNEDFRRVKEAYEKTRVKYEVFPFTNEMAKYYNLSDVVICRAGASTIFELAFFKKAAILIPYPFSAGGHQWHNASLVEHIGGGYFINNDEATGDRLYSILKQLMDNTALLHTMGENIATLYVDNAAQRIVGHIYDKTGK